MHNTVAATNGVSPFITELQPIYAALFGSIMIGTYGTYVKRSHNFVSMAAFVQYRSSDTIRFYRAMHFSAKRGIAVVCCPSVCLSVRLSVRNV